MSSNVLPGIDWDCGKIPYNYINPPYTLPTFFLVRVKEEENPRFVILKTSFVHRSDHNGAPSIKFWKLKVVDNPFLLIRGGETWHEDGTILPPFTYYIERDATEVRPLGIYSTTIKRTPNYLIMPHLNFTERVYEYTVTHPKNCLPPKYGYVLNDKDVYESYHFKGGYNMCSFKPNPNPIIKEVISTVIVKEIIHSIPTFVFHSFVTSAIEKKEVCPISLEPISKENVGCPPCGHLFDKEVLRRALKENPKCPTCRAIAKPEQIQIW